MSELSFLLDLLLNHKLPKPTRELVTARIKEVESSLVQAPVLRVTNVTSPPIVYPNQAPSMQAIMARHPDLAPAPPIPVEHVAQTAATAAALESRQQAIAAASKGIPNASGGKRKF